MIYVLLVFLCLTLVLSFKTKKKVVMLINIIILSAICYISTSLPDMANYTEFYNNVGNKLYSDFLGVGWLVLCYLGNFLGLSYPLFKSILYFIALCLIYKSITYITQNSQQTFVLYLIFPALLDLIQIRFFVAYSVVMFGFVYFLKSTKPIRYLLYFIALVISVLIHNLCIFFSIFFFIPFVKKYFSMRQLLSLTIIIVLFAIIGFKYITNAVKWILPEIQAERILVYFNSDHTSILGLIVYSLFFIVQLGVIGALNKSVKYDGVLKDKIKGIYVANVLLLLSIPFVFIDSDFMRLQRAFLFINYGIFLECNKRYRLKPLMIGKAGFSLNSVFHLSHLMYFVLFIVIFNYQSVILLF